LSDTNFIPDNLRIARRGLDALPSIKILNDWTWDKKCSRWVLYCELTIAEYKENPFVPQSTNWYVIAETDYPFSGISFLPSKINGIAHTFQHQRNNSKLPDDLPWRWRSICLDLNIKALGRFFNETEPFSTEERLAWYFGRALNWLKAAANGELAKEGEMFELPDFSENKDIAVVFSESASSFNFWKSSNDKAGTVELLQIQDTNLLVTKSFFNQNGKQILTPNWGKFKNLITQQYYTGIWIRINELPIFEPWQAPSIFGELINILQSQDINFYEVIKPALSKIRDGRKHILLLGFPIPLKYGESVTRIHWQSMLLPAISFGKETMKGFRNNENGRFLLDKSKAIGPNIELEWLRSENWHKEQISKRGKMPKSLSNKKILLVGCGAVGSAIAEFLVRGNANKIILLDNEKIEVGNLVRHTLNIKDIKKPKSQQLAQRLNTINPNAEVDFIVSDFPPRSRSDINSINSCDIIIDCTGDDEALIALSQFSWVDEKQFFSVNLNYGATKSFVFYYKGTRFPIQEYSQKIKAHLANISEIDDPPGDGIGCWHPTFPARSDDVWLLASACIKEIIYLLEHSITTRAYKFTVFEQIFDDDSFLGVRKIE
jgi:hypothetical protein